MDEATGDKDKLLTDQIKLQRYKQEYTRFSKAAGLRTENERAQVAGFGQKQATRARIGAKQYEKDFTSPENKAIIKAVSGARITNTESPAAEAHATRYYGLVRSMKTDVVRIAKNTGYSEIDIQNVKNFIFYEKHDLGDPKPRCFDPSFAMAQSWQRLINGTPKPHDITMLNHELLERELMSKGMSQRDAHIEASAKYNYTKESDDYYAALKKRKNRR